MEFLVAIVGLILMFIVFSAMCSVMDALVKKAIAGIPSPYDTAFLVMAFIATGSLAALIWVLT